jgi:hypothetical protein
MEPIAVWSLIQRDLTRLARSALPNAPVVADVEFRDGVRQQRKALTILLGRHPGTLASAGSE